MASNASSSTSTVIKNGIRITRSVHADEDQKVSKLNVVDKTQEIAVREISDGAIEIRVRSLKKNADGSITEKVYSAVSRDELKEQAPELVRNIERYEKMAGFASATVGPNGGNATSRAGNNRFSVPIPNEHLDAKEMMQSQLRKMLEQHADHPEMQRMIRRMMLDVGK
ncbi:hypothetical protein [Novipirellula herctigrandis]